MASPNGEYHYPPPADPQPRWSPLQLGLASGEQVVARNDHFSDRIRCEHPDTTDGQALGHALLDAAHRHGRGYVLVLARASLHEGLLAAGFSCDAAIPDFYLGKEDCVIATRAIDDRRSRPANNEAAEELDRLIEKPGKSRRHDPVLTTAAREEDAEAIASLLAQSFTFYPTPSGNPDYIARQIADGVPFRVVRDNGTVVACACADLVLSAMSAELTDCATAPEHRGRGYMQAILADLMEDLRRRGYPTAFTLARVEAIGMNLAFARLGFQWRGRTLQSCRIGGGLEDINVWSTNLPPDHETPTNGIGRVLIP